MTDRGIEWTRYLTVASLVVVLMVEIWTSLHDGAPWPVWLWRLLPLLLFVPGLYADRLRSYIWLCFVTLLYFLVAVLRLFSQPTDLVNSVGLVAVVTLFCSAMMYVRWRAQQLRRIREEAIT